MGLTVARSKQWNVDKNNTHKAYNKLKLIHVDCQFILSVSGEAKEL